MQYVFVVLNPMPGIVPSFRCVNKFLLVTTPGGRDTNEDTETERSSTRPESSVVELRFEPNGQTPVFVLFTMFSDLSLKWDQP